jgi:hypothetical protein
MSANIQNNDLNLGVLLREVWAARFFCFVGLSIGLLIAFVFVSIAEPRVEAQMIVSPADPLEINMQSRYQDGSNSYSLNASDTRSNNELVSHFVRFQALMRGSTVARVLLRDERIVKGLQNDRSFVFEGKKDILTPEDLASYIIKRVEVDPFGETSLKTLRYRHHDAAFAAYFLQQVHRVADQLIRADLRGQVDQRIAYLERVVAKTANPEQRRVMTNLMLEQERLRMLLSMDTPVAAAAVEPASARSHIVWPDPYLFYGGLGFIGLLLGYFLFGLVPYVEEESGLEEPVLRGEDLHHQPKRPLKYGSWFQNAPGNANDEKDGLRAVRRYSDATE